MLRELKTQFATMGIVGDGINDAPAMANAQISFAMGASLLVVFNGLRLLNFN